MGSWSTRRCRTDPAYELPLDKLPPNLRATVERLGIGPGQLSAARAPQLRAMHRRGVRIVTGTDAGAAPPKRHGGAWRAVVDLLLADLTVAEALATATSYAADACGIGDETGRLRPGLAADLLVVDGDLATDPQALGRPVAVLRAGGATTGPLGSRHEPALDRRPPAGGPAGAGARPGVATPAAWPRPCW